MAYPGVQNGTAPKQAFAMNAAAPPNGQYNSAAQNNFAGQYNFAGQANSQYYAGTQPNPGYAAQPHPPGTHSPQYAQSNQFPAQNSAQNLGPNPAQNSAQNPAQNSAQNSAQQFPSSSPFPQNPHANFNKNNSDPQNPNFNAYKQPNYQRPSSAGYYPQDYTVGPGPSVAAPDPNSEAQVQESLQFNAMPHFVRPSVSRLPNSTSVKQKAHLPFGLVVQPLATPPKGCPEVPSVNFGNSMVVRCKRCRSYVNPFIQWEANGRRWVCNMCENLNDTPQFYQKPLDVRGKREDRFERPELSLGSVEFIAPPDYMVRPPQPPTYMFVIDVSEPAVTSGMLDAVCQAIKHALSNELYCGGSRCMVGILTFDSTIHFHNLNSNLKQSQMVVVSSLADIFIPLPENILVPAIECKQVLEDLLQSLPNMFRNNRVKESCWGSAMRAAFTAMKHLGGKMLVFGSTIPTVGEFLLKPNREHTKQSQNTTPKTSREIELLRPDVDSYKLFADRLAKAQISVDLFLCPSNALDLASLAPVAKHTSGNIYFYPIFSLHAHSQKLQAELLHNLTRNTGWEAVMRFRVSKGWKITNWFGNYLFRGSDLLVIPSCNSDQTFAITVDLEENVIQDPVAYLQSALLYTNSDGERRIRVHSYCLPVTQQSIEITNGMDPQVTTALLCHQAIESALNSSLLEARSNLQTQLSQILGQIGASSESARALSLYVLGLLKSVALRDSKDVSADSRIFHWSRLAALPVEIMAAYFYPRLLSLHNLSADVGSLDDSAELFLPPSINLSSEQMTQDGAYLLDNGMELLLWIGKAISSQWIEATFGVPSFDLINPDYAEVSLAAATHTTGVQVRSVIEAVRRTPPFQKLYLIRQGDSLEHKFFASLIEDRTHSLMLTHQEFLAKLGPRLSQTAPPSVYGTAANIVSQQARHY